MRSSSPLPLYLAAAALWFASGAHALPTFTASGEADWFDGANWSGGVAPTASDDPLIQNGGTAIVSSDSPLYPGGGAAVQVNDLHVASQVVNDPAIDVSGALEMSDVDLSVAGSLFVGRTYSNPNAPGTASGSVSVAGGSQTTGNVSVGGRTVVGQASSDGSTATGALAVGGDLETTTNLEIGIGRLGFGEVTVGGDLRLVGIDFPKDGDFSSGDIRVGTHFGLEDGDIPETPTRGSLSVAGDLLYVDEGEVEEFVNSSLITGWTNGTMNTEGRVDVAGDVSDFSFVAVGMATPVNLSRVGEAVARGELHVEGKLAAPAFEDAYDNQLWVGVTSRTFLTDLLTAHGIATFGEIEPRVVEVGIAGSGPATGTLAIGSGDIAIAVVGEASSLSKAVGTLTTGGGIDDVTVGFSHGFDSNCQCSEPFLEGEAVGSVVAGGFVSKATVGLVNNDGAATGTLEVEGVRRLTSGEAQLVSVGVNNRGSGVAEGRMLVRSGGIDAARIAIGVSEGVQQGQEPGIANGRATGTLESTGIVVSRSAFGGDQVGYANEYSQGHADGTWILHDGAYSGRTLIVGLNQGTGSATGRVHLDHMFVDLGTLTLGDGATLEIDIAGLLRGTEYSAIDADVAQLDGDLEIAFTEPAQNGIYDLIISAALNGITGDFDSVAIAGLAADQNAFWGIESVGEGSNPVEVFRLHVVPEPTPGVLVALGLLALAMRARRARAVR